MIAGTPRERRIKGFVCKETIGEGSYGRVKIAANPDTGERIAIKIMSKRTLAPADSQQKPSSLARLHKEITVHRALRHRNIVQLYDTYEDAHFMFLLMELAAGGELFDKIVPDIGLDEQVAHFYFKQLVNAMVYLHSRGVAHRDLKPENMLLDARGNLKISDFGLATVYRHKGIRRKLTTPCGSPPYLAPEVAQGNYDGELADVWSMGIILFVLLHGCALWDEPTGRSPEFVNFIAARYDGKLGSPWTEIPTPICDLILGMLDVPNRRKRLDMVLKDPWTAAANPFYGEDGMCKDVEGLAHKMLARLDTHGETYEGGFDMVSFSQPHETTAGMLAPGAAWISSFSQPAHMSSSTSILLSQLTPSVHGGEFLPSGRLTRFFTQASPPRVHVLLTGLLSDLLAKHATISCDSLGCHITFSTVDKRRCPLLGDVRVQQVQERDLFLVLFVRRKGDPLEFKRLYRTLVARD